MREQGHVFHRLDDRRCVLKYLEITEQFKRSDSFFVSFSGARKGSKASRHTIARRLRLAISQAYIAKGVEVPEGIWAHSTRAMATSQAEWLVQHPNRSAEQQRGQVFLRISSSTTDWIYCLPRTRPLGVKS